MENGEIHLSSKQPSPPGDADFAIYIDFKKGEPNPQRIFQAADAMIRSFQRLDSTLCDSIDSSIKPILVLEDIQAGSLKIWLANKLEHADDDALKTLDWKPQVGKYLVKAKYAFIKWANKSEPNKSLVDLSREFQAIATQTDVKHLPDYKPPSVQDLIAVANDVERAKSFLSTGDKMSYLSGDNENVDFDLTLNWSPQELSDMATKETITFQPAPMILAVKKPDYLGTSKWDFRFGKKSISAKIEDEPWLRRFQNREIDVRPGDALKCMVGIEHGYGYDNELVVEKYTITQVTEVLANQYVQPSSLFGDENDES